MSENRNHQIPAGMPEFLARFPAPGSNEEVLCEVRALSKKVDELLAAAVKRASVIVLEDADISRIAAEIQRTARNQTNTKD